MSRLRSKPFCQSIDSSELVYWKAGRSDLVSMRRRISDRTQKVSGLRDLYGSCFPSFFGWTNRPVFDQDLQPPRLRRPRRSDSENDVISSYRITWKCVGGMGVKPVLLSCGFLVFMKGSIQFENRLSRRIRFDPQRGDSESRKKRNGKAFSGGIQIHGQAW